MRGVRSGGAHDFRVNCPSPSMPLVYVSRSLFEVPRGFSVAVRTSAGGGAQAGGEGRGSMYIHCALLPPPLLPFTVCVRSLSGGVRYFERLTAVVHKRAETGEQGRAVAWLK